MAFENRVLRRMFAPRRDDVTEGWRKLHNEEFRNLYYSPSTTKIIILRKIKSARRAARRGRREMHI
jgi:hypothetical protein